MKQHTNLHLQAVREKYEKLNARLQKSLKEGRFLRFSFDKKRRLFQSLTRYEKQLRQWGIAVATGVAMLLPGADALAQGPTSLGSEFQVNTWTSDAQVYPTVATDNDGNFIITWMSFNQASGSSSDIYAQRYNNVGVAQGSEFRVNTYTSTAQRNPSIAMDSDGDFVVTWDSYIQDGSLQGVYAQRYNHLGEPQGSEFRVNTFTTGLQYRPSVAMDSDGDFVVTWVSLYQDGSFTGVYAQRYNNLGEPQGSEFRVNTYTTDYQQESSVAMDSDGDFVVTWESRGQDGSIYGVYAQRYNQLGEPQGSEFRVNTYTTHTQSYPSIAMNSNGDFVVTWESAGQDGSTYGIYGQSFNNLGVPLGSEFRVNTYTTSSQYGSSIAMNSEGDFVIAWNSFGQDGSGYGVYAQSYNNLGLPLGSEFRVNTFTTDNQFYPSIAMDSDGDFVVTWIGYGQDGSDYGVYAQRYEVPCTPTNWYADTDGDGYGSETAISACTQPANTSTNNTDCNDSDIAIYPGAQEICNSNVDDDCNELADNADPFVFGQGTYYADVDGDTYGAGDAILSCTQPANTSTVNFDCNDSDIAIYPGAQEICNSNVDDDCNELADNADPFVFGQSTYYTDMDGDNYGAGATFLSCTQLINTSVNNTDCDDTNASIKPGATELCNGLDDNCDNIVDNVVKCPKPAGLVASNISATGATITWTNLPCATSYIYRYRSLISPGVYTAYTAWATVNTNTTNLTGLLSNKIHQWTVRAICGSKTSAAAALKTFTTLSCQNNTYYADLDGDGSGDLAVSITSCDATPPAGYAANSLDCDDTNPAINPAAQEICDGIDNDCDGLIAGDEGLVFYLDADGDGYGNPSMTTISCTLPGGYSASSTDCNDAAAISYPGASELCDGLDNNCDNIIDNVVICPTPTGLAATNLGMTSATINWNPISCAVNGYQYRYRSKIGGVFQAFSPWTPVPSNTAMLTGLLPTTYYLYQVRTSCYGNNMFSEVISASFTTLGASLIGIEDGESNISGSHVEMGFDVVVYPNPNTGKFTTAIHSEYSDIPMKLFVTDGLGRVLQQMHLVLNKGMNQHEIDLTAYPDAIYFLELYSDKTIGHYPVIKSGN